ncbi:MAG: DUF1311 domain-containing protein [Proteobacteria bacterium]|nr:DUF1311 domain-containing protein [Pseudomonadota bacterium]
MKITRAASSPFILIISAMLSAAPSALAVPSTSKAPQPGVRLAQTQLEMNEQAAEDFKKADAELNAIYKKVMAASAGEQKQAIITAQLAWIKFRDANADAWAAPNKGGSIYPLIWLGAKTRTTRTRTAELKQLLEEHQQH